MSTSNSGVIDVTLQGQQKGFDQWFQYLKGQAQMPDVMAECSQLTLPEIKAKYDAAKQKAEKPDGTYEDLLYLHYYFTLLRDARYALAGGRFLRGVGIHDKMRHRFEFNRIRLDAQRKSGVFKLSEQVK